MQLTFALQGISQKEREREMDMGTQVSGGTRVLY